MPLFQPAQLPVVRPLQQQEREDWVVLERGEGGDLVDRGPPQGPEFPAGPIDSWARVSISADGVSAERLREIVETAERHSPVTDALCRAVPHRLQVELR